MSTGIPDESAGCGTRRRCPGRGLGGVGESESRFKEYRSRK
ncbi:hypothetical protein HMPREF0043_00470 [Actinobaculum sp. oral taxon 183 str. F0552]|nr:hypothetical protein HMPREF0043_00470 [Actinobaculum sp. oral taxon 183 str. F0552]